MKYSSVNEQVEEGGVSVRSAQSLLERVLQRRRMNGILYIAVSYKSETGYGSSFAQRGATGVKK